MYFILYTGADGKNTWEVVSGEDAMQIRVDELCKELNLDADEDIIVFDGDTWIQ